MIHVSTATLPLLHKICQSNFLSKKSVPNEKNMNYYEVLNVTPDASFKEIERSYYSLRNALGKSTGRSTSMRSGMRSSRNGLHHLSDAVENAYKTLSVCLQKAHWSKAGIPRNIMKRITHAEAANALGIRMILERLVVSQAQIHSWSILSQMLLIALNIL